MTAPLKKTAAIQPPAWIREYEGKAFANDGWGPDRFHCYGLLAAVMREQFGIDAPVFPQIALHGNTKAERRAAAEALLNQRHDWVQAIHPQPGDAILLRVGKKECHVGVVVALRPRPAHAAPAGWMLHVSSGMNVTCEEWQTSKWKNRVVGFWRYAGERKRRYIGGHENA